MSKRYIDDQTKTFASILYIQWHVTCKCEENCAHCYNGQVRQSDLSLEENKIILQKIVAYGNTIGKDVYIAFTGGDPLLYKGIYELWDICNENHINIIVKGNPHLLTNSAVLAGLKEHGIISYQMSLDGPSDEHDRIRSPGSYKKTISAFKLLVDNRITSVCKYTVSSYNAHGIIPTIKQMDALGVSYFGASRMLEIGNAKENKLQKLDPQEYYNIMKDINNYRSKNISIIHYDPLWIPFFYMESRTNRNIVTKHMKCNTCISGCPIWEDSFCINSQGVVMACSRIPGSDLGSLVKQEFSDIVKSCVLDRLRDISKIKKCNSCKLKYMCRGCRAADISVLANDPEGDPYCFFDSVTHIKPRD